MTPARRMWRHPFPAVIGGILCVATALVASPSPPLGLILPPA
jgi:hypothetical protein